MLTISTSDDGGFEELTLGNDSVTTTIIDNDVAPSGGFWIAQQGNSNQSQAYELEEGHNSKGNMTFNVQFGTEIMANGSMNASGDKSIAAGESRTITFELSGTATPSDFTFEVDSNSFSVSSVLSGNQLIVTLTNDSGVTKQLTGNPFTVTVTKVDDTDTDDGETLTMTIIDSIWPEENNFINFVISDDDGSAPIAIDLDDDGIEYLGREAGVVFTDSQTGQSVNTAWVGPEDGLLVIDANGSGTVDETREYVFTEWSDTAETDLAAVAEVFDTNQDGVLDAQDAQWEQFGIWQDLNSDGVTDANELVSLTELGVESIELSYREDSTEGAEADGDVVIHGQASVNWADGTTTTAEDTSFAIDAADVIAQEDDIPLPEAGQASPMAGSGAPQSDTATDTADMAISLLEADLLIRQDDDTSDFNSES